MYLKIENNETGLLWARRGDRRDAYRDFMRNPEGRKPL
jgi:hypothetical protein